MSQSEARESVSWKESLYRLVDPRSITMLFLGFSAGLPLLMIFSTLSLWLREAGVERSAVTYFSWAALGYSFKFVWAPLVDKLPLPLLSKLLGRRRSWLLLSQFMIAGSVCAMAMIDPAASPDALVFMACAAVALGFSAATQDICIDAFRIESAEQRMQGTLSALYIAGYRVGMLVSGAGALALASHFGTEMEQYNYQAWRWTYFIMACCMIFGVVTTLLRPEPKVEDAKYSHATSEYLRFFALFLFCVLAFVFLYILLDKARDGLSPVLQTVGFNQALIGFLLGAVVLTISIAGVGILVYSLSKSRLVNSQLLEESYVGPVRNFFQSNGKKVALLFLAVIGLYRISDIVLGVIANVFYQDLGFSKDDIAFVVKTFGLGMTLLGGVLGGVLTTRYGIYKVLLWGAVLAAMTNLLFMQFALMGGGQWMFYLVISADNLAGGIAVAAFVAFLSSLTNISFTAVQYAIFSSVMTLVPKVIGGYSGAMVDTLGYPGFFILTALIGLPVVLLVVKTKPYIKA